MYENIVEHFQAGGVWMYLIAIFQMFSFVIIIDRFWVLFVKTRVRKKKILSNFKEKIYAGDLAGGLRFLSEHSQSLISRILKEGLLHVPHGEQEVQAAMDEAALQEIPRLEKRVGYLAMIANGATLAGLLGTVFGMIKVFAAVGSVSAADKSVMLSNGISEAMNCTAYGLITAIPPLVCYAFLQARVQNISDDVNSAVASTVNFGLRNQDKLKIETIKSKV